MTTVTIEAAKQAIDGVLLAARELKARHIEIIVRNDLAFIQFNHEEWTQVHTEWTKDHANHVMNQFFRDLKRTEGFEEDPRPEEATLDRSNIGIRAHVSTTPLWPEGCHVSIKLL